MRKTIASLAIAASLAAASPADASPRHRCSEDQPCWNWATMGNKQRGVMTKSGKRVVVSPAKFRALYFNGRINLRGQRMRGDATALRTFNVQNY